MFAVCFHYLLPRISSLSATISNDAILIQYCVVFFNIVWVLFQNCVKTSDRAEVEFYAVFLIVMLKSGVTEIGHAAIVAIKGGAL